MSDDYEQLKQTIRRLRKNQRDVLDTHGCGGCGGHPKTLEKLERLGLLEGFERIFYGRFPMRIRDYRMPLRVNMAWAEICSEEVEAGNV